MSVPPRRGSCAERIGRRVERGAADRMPVLGGWLLGNVVLVATALLGLAVALMMTVASAEIYDAVGERDGVSRWDRPVLVQMMRWRTPVLDRVVTWFTDLGGTAIMPVLAAVATVALAVRWRSWAPVVLMLIATAGSLVITVVGKQAIGRVRPPLADAVPPYETSPSFPSGHALNSLVVAGLVAYLVWRRVPTARTRITVVSIAVVFVVAMGWSRVFLGHHWLTDVLVAWTIGLAWLAVVITGHRIALAVVRTQAPTVDDEGASAP